ncbi:leucine-rich repeat neuronal protein 4-like [Arapaima gigas]
MSVCCLQFRRDELRVGRLQSLLASEVAMFTSPLGLELLRGLQQGVWLSHSGRESGITERFGNQSTTPSAALQQLHPLSLFPHRQSYWVLRAGRSLDPRRERRGRSSEEPRDKPGQEKSRQTSSEGPRIRKPARSDAMAPRWTSALLLLLLSPVPLYGQSTEPAAAPPPILFITVPSEDDYSYLTEAPDLTRSGRPDPTRSLIPKLCDYDPCRDLQVPCDQLTESLGCLCPGVSGPHVRPSTPRLRSVRQEGSAVVVRWCSPFSTVLQFRVTVRNSSTTVSGSHLRKLELEHVDPGATVCVEAINEAGSSEKSCGTYEVPRVGDLAIKAGLAGGALSLLLLLSVVGVLLWRRKGCRKAGGHGEGVGNPSYTRDGTL